MSNLARRAATQEVARAVLAADCACSEAAFVEDGLLVTAAEERPGRRRYPASVRPLAVVTMGRGVVVSCHPERIAWLRETLESRSREAIFGAATIAELAQFVARDGQTFHGPAFSHVCAPETFRSPADPDGIDFSVVAGEAVRDLYQHPGFGNALSYQPDHPRPDVAAAVARRGGEIVGIAGMSADCETMWQIGIDVVSGERGGGVGRALVGRLTELAFRHGRVPSYTADIANVRSLAVPSSLGYWPAWVELFARDAQDV